MVRVFFYIRANGIYHLDPRRLWKADLDQYGMVVACI